MISRQMFFFNPFRVSLLLCLSGIFLAFPNPVLHIPFFIFLFFLGLNLIAFNARSLSAAFRWTLFSSGFAYALGLYWVVVPVHVYGNFPFVLAVFCPLLLGFVLGLFSCAYVIYLYLLRNRFSWFWLGIFGGAAWGSLEFAREYLFTGFPWLIAAQAFSVWPETIQAVGLVGSYGLGMFLACAGLWMSCGQRISLVAGLLLLAMFLVPGFWLGKQEYHGPVKDILVVQGNIEQDIKWEEEIQVQTVKKYQKLTLEGLGDRGPDLVIWPETAMPFYFQEKTRLSLMVRDFVQEQNINLITGSPAYEMLQDDSGVRLYNRAFWAAPSGRIIDYYDKERLGPFGEYIPWSDYLFFLNRLVSGPLDFSPGYATGPLIQEDLAIGMLICYEIIFPGLVRERVASGANLLVNISNDAWFGKTSAPEQHLHLSVLRAVEQGRFIVRSTNTGISAFIDPQGRVYQHTNLFQDAFLRGEVNLLEQTTFYHRWHWPIHWALVIISLSGLGLSLTRKASRAGMIKNNEG